MNILNNIEELKHIGQLQEGTIVNAECLEAMRYIADGSVDMILCDLPYG